MEIPDATSPSAGAHRQRVHHHMLSVLVCTLSVYSVCTDTQMSKTATEPQILQLGALERGRRDNNVFVYLPAVCPLVCFLKKCVSITFSVEKYGCFLNDQARSTATHYFKAKTVRSVLDVHFGFLWLVKMQYEIF